MANAASSVGELKRWLVSNRDTSAQDLDVPFDVLFDVLSNERRRWVCRYFDALSEPIELGSLSEFVAAIENHVPEGRVTSTARKRVYISLYQCHLPKMDDSGAVRFDSDRKVVRPGQYLEHFTACISLAEDRLRAGDDP